MQSVYANPIMRLSKFTGECLGYLGIFLILLPKVNLVAIQRKGAGIRLDDILLFGCLLLFVMVMFYALPRSISRLEITFSIWILYLLATNAFNIFVFQRSSPLYSLRFVEYFLFYYMGFHFSRQHRIQSFAKWILWVNTPVILLQEIGVIGGFASAGYAPQLARPIGLTGGPWEIGVLINFSFAVLIFSKAKRPWLLFLFTTTLIIMTASRMSMLANVVLVVIYYFRQNRKSFFSTAIKIGIVLTILGTLLVVIPNSLEKRSENLFTMENLEHLKQVYRETPDDPPLDSFNDLEITDQNSDMSWLMRIGKWTKAVKLWTRSAATILIGVGPGSFGVALDGGWLRVLTESGILGLIVMLIFARQLWKISPVVRSVLVAIAINMLMIDIYISYKVMASLFFIAGALSSGEFDHSRDTADQQDIDRSKSAKLFRLPEAT